MIGITRTGVAIYNPLNEQAENAVEGPIKETFDSCDGHKTFHITKYAKAACTMAEMKSRS